MRQHRAFISNSAFWRPEEETLEPKATEGFLPWNKTAQLGRNKLPRAREGARSCFSAEWAAVPAGILAWLRHLLSQTL